AKTSPVSATSTGTATTRAAAPRTTRRYDSHGPDSQRTPSTRDADAGSVARRGALTLRPGRGVRACREERNPWQSALAIAGKSVPQLLGALVVQVRCGPPRPEGRIAGARLYRDVPPLSTKLKVEGVWNVEFHRELDMTDDAWRFRRRDWLLERGCRLESSAFVAPTADWYKS